MYFIPNIITDSQHHTSLPCLVTPTCWKFFLSVVHVTIACFV